MTEKKMSDEVVEQITEENMKFAHLLEGTAFMVQEAAKKFSTRVDEISDAMLKLPMLPSNFVFNVGTLTGELDQVVGTMESYLTAYNKFREVYLIQVKHEKKEDLH